MPCNYSWPWPKIDVDIVGCWVETPRGFLHSSFPLFLALVRLLFISFVLLRLFYDPGYIPAEWNGAEDIDRIVISLFVFYTLLYNLSRPFHISFSFSLFPSLPLSPFRHDLFSFFVRRRYAHYAVYSPEHFRRIFHPCNRLDATAFARRVPTSIDAEGIVHELSSFYSVTSAARFIDIPSETA